MIDKKKVLDVEAADGVIVIVHYERYKNGTIDDTVSCSEVLPIAASTTGRIKIK